MYLCVIQAHLKSWVCSQLALKINDFIDQAFFFGYKPDLQALRSLMCPS